MQGDESTLDFRAGATQRGSEPGASVDLRASLTECGVPFAGTAHVWAEVTLPSGVSARVNLYPTGAGAYAATFITIMMGLYVCRIRAAGATSADVCFTRETTATAGVWLASSPVTRKPSNPVTSLHVRRPYFFELFTLANFAAIAIWMAPSLPPRRWLVALLFLPVYLGLAIAGVAIRYVVARWRGRSRALLRVFRSRRWLTDSARLVVFTTWTTFTYGCIKLLIPLGHPRLFDRELWNLDAKLFFGMSPNVFFASLFGNPIVLKVIDWTYANVFIASLWIASMYFLSSPRRRTRIAFMSSNCLLWLIGAWLYMLVPSLGPAYRFPDVWLPLAQSLGRTQFLQRLLMTNYQAVLHGAPANILYGIAAFPSLHVGFVALVFFWMRKLERWGAPLFGVLLVLIFVGSVVTGWHYLIDALAGLVLGWLCYAAASRLSGSRRTPRETPA